MQGDYTLAEEQFRLALTGIYANDPELLSGLTRAQFAQQRPADARATLDALIAANPTFGSREGHLVCARSVEAGGDVQATLHEYEALTGYPGEEARVRHARLLARHGDADKARSLLQETLDRSAAAPHYYRKLQRDWIEAARRELQALAPR